MNHSAHTHTHSHSVPEQMFTVPTSKPFKHWISIINFWIYVSCISLAMETLEPFASTYKSLFWTIELVAVGFFSVDYIGNVYFAKSRIKYIFSFWGLVDLISILPTFLVILNLGALQGAKVLRILRVVRVLRVLKMAKAALQELSNKVKSTNPLITNLRIYFIALFVAQALNIDLTPSQEITILLVAMLTSKGASGVTGSGFITLAATLAVIPSIPVAGLALILGIDRFMSEARAITNFIGNGVATVVVARWENELDKEQMAAAMKG